MSKNTAEDVGANPLAPPQPVAGALSLAQASDAAFAAMKDGPLRIFDNQLAALYYANGPDALAMSAFVASTGQLPNALVDTPQGQYVLVDFIARDRDGAHLLSELQALGIKNGSSFGAVASGFVPVANLGGLLDVANIVSAHESGFVTSAGAVNTQADPAQKADVARATYGVTGAGLRVGVLSDSFNKATTPLTTQAQDIASGDLPTDTVVVQDYTSGTDEGRAMAQLVHDIAPGASIDFATGNFGQAGFANNIKALATAGDKVIVDDLIYFAEPMYQNGVIGQAAKQVVAAGSTYLSSAGNNGIEGYQGNWVSGAAYTYSSANYTLMNFAPGQDYIKIVLGSSERIVLQWDSPAASAGGPGATSDLDIFFTDISGAVVAGIVGTTNNLGADPVEVLGISGGTGGTYYLRVGARSGSPLPTNIRIVALGNGAAVDLDNPASNTNQGTVYGHAVAEGVIGVAAAGYSKTPYYGSNPPVAETFTSRGTNTFYFTDAGVRLSTPTTRAGALVTGVDGGNTTFFSSDDGDADTLPNFYGTSAAAPDVAGVAALLLQKDSTLTPSDILGLLQSSSIDMDDRATTGFDTGFDQSTGTGLIQADRALAFLTTRQITNPGDSPYLRGTHYNETISGAAGADTLAGAGGADYLTGGAGADTFLYFSVTDSTSAAQDVISDFTSFSDKIDLTTAIGPTGAVAINRSGFASTVYFSGSTGSGGQIGVNGVVQGSDFVAGAGVTFYITGDGGNDVIYGSAGVDYINGNGGADSILGGLGADVLTGGAGVDVFYYTAIAQSSTTGADQITDFATGVDKIDLSAATGSGGSVAVNRSGGLSTVYFAAAGGAGGTGQISVNGLVQGYDFAFGPSTAIYITGDNGADVIYGSDLADNIDGGGGNDAIAGGLGADRLTGGAGSDTFYWQQVAHSTTAAPDYITDFATGVDRLDLNTALGTGGAIAVNRSGFSTTLYFQRADGAGGTGQIGINGQVQGYDFVGGAYTLYITGDAGPDVIYGSDRADVINGGGGDDAIQGGLGADTITGGDGADTFYYSTIAQSTSSATDYVADFTTGQDRIDLNGAVGSGGAIAVNRSGFSSTIYFQNSSGGAGGTGQISVNGIVQGYDFVGGSYALYITGDGGPDVIYGGNGNDTINGGGGDDAIQGGLGADVLTGGAGADTFYYSSTAQSTAGSQDSITDFATGTDRLNFQGLGAGAVNVAFVGGSTAVTFAPSGGGTVLSLQVTGQVRFTDISAAAGVTFTGNGAPVGDPGAEYAPGLIGHETAPAYDRGLA